MNRSPFHAPALAVLAMLTIAQSAAIAATVRDATHAAPVQLPQTQPLAPVALPLRTDVLRVDWVDTKNARIAIGGITYAVKGAQPDIVLQGGGHVTDIGYLKSGMQVRIRTAPEGAASHRLLEITVVG